VLAAGILAATGVLLRERLGDLVGNVLKEAAHDATHARRVASGLAGDAREQAHVSVEKLLHAVGLQQRSTTRSIVGPAAGVALGFVAGAALTYLFAPQLVEKLAANRHEGDVAHDTSEPQDAAESGVGGSRPNGSMVSPVS
jgi:hypothetical protein